MFLENDEPEADQFFGVKKSVKIPPRHYGITHIQCKDLKEAVMLWVDEELKRKYPSMWADTYYVNPFKVSVTELMPSTANSQVNQTHVDSVPTTTRSEQQPPVAGAQVSTNPEVSPDTSDASVLSKQSTKNPVTIPYVIFNLSLDAHIYIPKGTIIAHPNGNEPEVDVIKVAETIKEAKETMQYRNHLPSRPWLPMPPTADVHSSRWKTVYHPVSYISVLFRGSQLNWAALMKEVYAIYMSVRKLSFYLTNADVLIRSDHLPLKKFLKQNTMNSKVNNWAIKLESYNLKFEYIQGIQNTLADTLSRLIEIDPDVTLPMEPPGTDFGYNFFQELPPVEVDEIIVEGVKIKPDPDTFFKDIDLTLPLKARSIRSLQAKDAKINNILQQLQVGDLPPNIYLIEDGVLRRKTVEPTGNEFKPIIIPKSLVDHILMTAHDHGGHNGFPRMYAAIRHLYF